MMPLALRIAPHHARQLSRMFTRMGAEQVERARSVTRGELRGLVTPDGRVTDRALPALLGDVLGAVSATVVARLQGRPLAATAPTIGQAIGWTGTTWAPMAVIPATHWEPISNGDTDDPQLLFGADGDVLMAEVPN